METAELLNRVEGLVVPVLANLGYRLVEREFLNVSGRWTLRLYIDREGGVMVADCERASRAVEDLLEVEEAIPMRYDLEVSSPGLYRPLRYREDFERFRGAAVRIKASQEIDGRRNYKGTLEGLEGDDIVVIVDGTRYRVPLAILAKAHIEPDEESLKPKSH